MKSGQESHILVVPKSCRESVSRARCHSSSPCAFRVVDGINIYMYRTFHVTITGPQHAERVSDSFVSYKSCLDWSLHLRPCLSPPPTQYLP